MQFLPPFVLHRERQGHVATFKVDATTGEATLVKDVTYEYCHKMQGITANADGSIIAVLCQAYNPVGDGVTVPGCNGMRDGKFVGLQLSCFKEGAVNKGLKDPADPPGTINLLGSKKKCPTSTGCTTEDCAHWSGSCYPMAWYSDLDAKMYLLEYTGGAVTSSSATRTVLISHSIGGSNYGNQEISLNAAQGKAAPVPARCNPQSAIRNHNVVVSSSFTATEPLAVCHTRQR